MDITIVLHSPQRVTKDASNLDFLLSHNSSPPITDLIFSTVLLLLQQNTHYCPSLKSRYKRSCEFLSDRANTSREVIFFLSFTEFFVFTVVETPSSLAGTLQSHFESGNSFFKLGTDRRERLQNRGKSKSGQCGGDLLLKDSITSTVCDL